MPVPTYLVYLSFGAGAQVDVTAYATNVTIDRGSPRILDDTQVGQATVSFINNDRTFDPFNTSSVLYDATNGYTRVQPNAKVQISAGGVVIFTGWVQNWDFTNDEKGLDARATLTATDGLGVLAKANFNPTLITAANTASFARDRIAAATATWGSTAISLSYYSGKTPLVADTFSATDTVLAYLQNVARTEPFDFWGKKDGNAQIRDRTLTFAVYTIGTPIYNYHTTAGFYNGTATDLTNWTDAINISGVSINLTTNPGFPGEYVAESIGLDVDYGLAYSETDSAKYLPNTPYSLSFWTDATSLTAILYLYQRATGTALKASKSTAVTFSGGWNQVKIENVTTALSMNTLEFYATGPSSFQIKDLLITPSTAVPTLYFDGQRNQQGSDYLNSSAIVATGYLGEERNSNSVYLTKTATGATATPLPIFESFGDAYGTAVIGTALPISDLQVQYASDQFYNQINVVRASGGTAVKNDTVSQGLYGIRTFGQGDSLGISPSRSTAFANEIYAQLGSPDYVLTSLDVQLEAMAGTAQTRCLNLELFDLARVVFRPSATGSNIDKKYTIINMKHEFNPETYRISFGLAPFSQGLFLDSTYLGILDTQEVV
jgi:hypothetical protein